MLYLIHVYSRNPAVFFLLLASPHFISSAIAKSGSPAPTETFSIDIGLAKRYFQEAEWASDGDQKKIWGIALYGPMMFIDPVTRLAVANQADHDGKLKEKDGVWVGTLPFELPFANTALDWSGTHWSMVIWQMMPAETAIRVELLLHESFHRIQNEVGLAPSVPQPTNVHLDQKEGRIWMKMEYRALARALSTEGADHLRSLTDALIFRAYRRKLFAGSPLEEDRMEMHEGMAAYTGIHCMGLGNAGARAYLAGRLYTSASKPSFSFAFAYETGPAYALMLDSKNEHWRSGGDRKFEYFRNANGPHSN